jgi:predicted SnoaL-like aldol condensation-catalyzing enzyme
MAGDGLDALKGFVEMVKMVDKPQKIGIMRSAADADLVWTHSRVNFFGTTFAAADIFRIECGKIIEHWDVLQDTKLMMEARNAHPFF